jgi:hypothetical protein
LPPSGKFAAGAVKIAVMKPETFENDRDLRLSIMISLPEEGFLDLMKPLKEIIGKLTPGKAFFDCVLFIDKRKKTIVGELDLFIRSSLLQDDIALRKVGDPHVFRLSIFVDIRTHQSGDDLQKGGFAAPVRPDQCGTGTL